MAKKSKLLNALDEYKSRDYKSEKEKKVKKQTEKRRRQRLVKEEEERKLLGLQPAKDVEDEDSEGLEGSHSEVSVSHLLDSDSDSDDEQLELKEPRNQPSTMQTDAVNEEDSDAESIALSAVSGDEDADIIPHHRLTVDNHPALLASLARIVREPSSLFSTYMCHTVPTTTSNLIPDIDDDLARELAFYKQSLASVVYARKELATEPMPIPFSRPKDYFAEMVKSDEQMGKVRDKLREDAAAKMASAEAKRQRSLKKFGKQVQVAKELERAKEKRTVLGQIEALKRKRKASGTLGDATTEADNDGDVDLFDVGVDATESRALQHKRARRGDPGARPNPKRVQKNAKYGFGGKKRHSKSGDAESTGDMRGFVHRKHVSKRPGKNRRKVTAGRA